MYRDMFHEQTYVIVHSNRAGIRMTSLNLDREDMPCFVSFSVQEHKGHLRR